MNTKNDVPIKAPSQTYKTASSARSVTDGEIVLATVDVMAPAERVFSALTTNEAERWWGGARRLPHGGVEGRRSRCRRAEPRHATA